MAHLGHLGEEVGAIVELAGGLEVEGFGNPTDELREALAAFNVSWYAPLT